MAVKRLGGTDALFLSMETPRWHQHVAGLTILDPAGSDVSFEDIVAKLAERIPYAPKFTWKVKEFPLGLDRPIYVDDPDFDVRRHVRRVAVPSPGGPQELGELAGMLASSQLDRRRPLWELWVIEGLADGKLACFMKYHHCLLDGVAGASLATALFDLEPDTTDALVPLPPEEQRQAGPAPSELQMLAEALRPDPRRLLRLGRFASGLVAKAATAIDSVRRDTENRALLRAPATPFNGNIGTQRQLSFASVALADLQRLKDAHDVKVNDVVLAVAAGALRRYLLDQEALPSAPLVTGVPVSTRPKGDESLDNQVSTMFASLATDVDDPIERLHAIHRSTQSAKAMSQAIGARQIQSIGEVAAPMILGAAIKATYRTQLLSRVPIRINTVVSNVPGPPVPLYMCGAKVVGVFPSSVILEGMGLNVTCFSYVDRMDFGFQVDPDLVPDPWALAHAVPEALAELLEASSLGDPTPVVQPLEGATAPAPVEPRTTEPAGAPA